MRRSLLLRVTLAAAVLAVALGAVGLSQPGPLTDDHDVHVCTPATGAVTVGVTQFSHEGSDALVLGAIELQDEENVDLLGAKLIPVPGQPAIGSASGWAPDPSWRSLGAIEPDGQQYHLVFGLQQHDPAQDARFDGVEIVYTHGERIERDELPFAVTIPRAGQSCAGPLPVDEAGAR